MKTQRNLLRLRGDGKLTWLKKRWLEYRWGNNYISTFLGFAQLLLLLGLYPLISGFGLLNVAVLLSIPLVLVNLAIGQIHKRYQLETDAVTSYQPIFKNIEEIVRRVVREELENQKSL